jgi:branched-subunit amino acid transport protein
MNPSLYWIIFGMAVVTYLPRMAPLVFMNGKGIPSSLKRVMENVPYTLLGALLFPGILHIKPEDMGFGLVGAVTAIALAYFDLHLILPVLGSVLALTVYQMM